MAWRTACSPPRSSCSATGICSGRSAASMALRCTVDVGATGRSPRAGPALAVAGAAPAGPARSAPAAWRCHARRARRARRATAFGVGPAPSTRHRVARALAVVVAPPLARPGARMTDTSGARFGVPLTSIRPSVFSGERAGFAGVSDRISMPSSPTSTSARSTAPTFSPAGTRAPSTVPLGWRAPAARQVHDPSPVWLVSSMSMRRDMRRTRYLAWHRPPMPGHDRHPITWAGRPPECGSRRDGPSTHRAAVRRCHVPSGGST